MTVVFDRPYQFVPPHHGVIWPFFIQKLRLVDWYLRRKEGIVSWECRGIEHLKRSLDRGDGILLAPNHCRYADPLVLGWPARLLKTNVYAMASWHLFNQGRFNGFAIQKMGGFSIHREGVDRLALETAITSLTTAERPLVLFPEGTTNRSNDVLKPLLDGVSFIARSAARRRQKKSNGNVVIHPIAIKYLCVDDICDWARQRLEQIEQRFGWQTPSGLSIAQRTRRIVDGAFVLREVEHLGTTGPGTKEQRLEALIATILQRIENRLAMQPGACSTKQSTAAGSHRPAPAARVSLRCRAGESSAPIAAAKPPWAQRLAGGVLMSRLSKSTLELAGSSRALIKPATPLPMTTTSQGTANNDSVSSDEVEISGTGRR